MIGPEQMLVSYTIGAFPIEHIYGLRQKHPKFGVFEWDEETYFWVHGECAGVFEGEGHLVRIGVHKPEDPSAHWEAPENRVLVCTLDQPILSATGEWVEVQNLEVGQRLQHFCGNGHTAMVDSIDFIGKGRCFGLRGVYFGTIAISGMILKCEVVGVGLGREDEMKTARSVGLSRWGWGT